MNFHQTVVRLFTIPAVLALGGATISQASTITGDITATFTNPVLIGNVANENGIGSVTFADNSATAVYSGIGTNTLTWGTGLDLNEPPGEEFSQLVFTGASNVNLSGTNEFIGTISFLNGTSDIDTIIFGATINFYANGNLLGSDNVTITTTSNQNSGIQTDPTLLAEDADYINICGNSSSICDSSLESYEDSETGMLLPVVANLNADLDFDLTNIQVTANTSSLGTVGNLPPLGQVPEPSPVLLTLTILGGCGLAFARRSSAKRSL